MWGAGPSSALRRAAVTVTVAALACAAPPLASADDAAPGSLAASARIRLEWLTAAGSTLPRDTPVNPENAVLQLPSAAASTELRPDLRLEAGRDLSAFVRPRLLALAQKPRIAGAWQPETSDASVEWIDLYASWRADEHVAFAYGVQNYQWGPAELVSPSNRIFHVTGFFRDPLYVVRGRHLARVNLSAGRAWSAVLLVEVRDNGEQPFVAGEPFEPKAEAKLEWSDPGGRGYLAVTGGAGKTSRGFFGEYGSLSIGDGFSVYADAVHQMGSRAWIPVETAPGVARFEHALADAGLRTLALGGVRYTFAGGTDLRLEYLFDETGWDVRRLRLAERAAAVLPGPPPVPGDVGPWFDPGYEVVGRQHAYASLSIPDLPPRERTAIAVRYLVALEDGSGALFGTASYDATDAVVLFASATATYGSDHGALSRLARASALVGATVSW
jgi:hypothetical protein